MTRANSSVTTNLAWPCNHNNPTADKHALICTHGTMQVGNGAVDALVESSLLLRDVSSFVTLSSFVVPVTVSVFNMAIPKVCVQSSGTTCCAMPCMHRTQLSDLHA